MLDNSCAVFVVEVRLEMAIGAMSLGKQEVMIAIWTKNKLFLGSISNQGCVFSHLSSAPWGSNCMRFNNSIVQIVTALHGKRCWMLTQHNTTTYSTCQVAHMLEDFFQTWIRVDHQICCQSHSPPLKNVENTCKSYHQPTSAIRSSRFVAPSCMGCAMPRSPYVGSAAFHFGAPDVCDAGQNHCGLCQAKVGRKQKSKKSRRKLDESGKVWESVELMQSAVDIFWKLFVSLSVSYQLGMVRIEWVGTVQHISIAPVTLERQKRGPQTQRPLKARERFEVYTSMPLRGGSVSLDFQDIGQVLRVPKFFTTVQSLNAGWSGSA